ncbi:hypothetical protein [Virgibacillus halodenitrificans]|nr:hypothetical protein [Virgibacillus halodenitrificans]
MMEERLEEILEEHKPNLEVLEHLSPDSFENLYFSLVSQLVEVLDGNTNE